MDAIRIYGGRCLDGQTVIQGSKNAALPILAATLLINGVCEIENCPVISDVYHMLRLMKSLGCRIEQAGNLVRIDTTMVSECTMPSDSVGGMRSSITLLGALLARTGRARMEYPGGCVIGKRPIDLHLSGLRRMNVTIKEDETGFEASVSKLKGAVHRLPFVSVGATENLILAAVLAEGETVIEPAASEPEIQTLCEFLCEAGADISGIGSKRLVIKGVDRLFPIWYRVPPDRIVAGTYLTACLCAGGRIFLQDAPVQHMQAAVDAAAGMGAKVLADESKMEIICRPPMQNPAFLQTDSYPGFPTDLQSLFLSAMTVASGIGVMEETVFENRYRIVDELKKMGADITVCGNKAYVCGVPGLHGANVYAKELRGGAALVVAGARADGVTVVCNKHYIDRGYENIIADMKNMGVMIEACDGDGQ